MAFDSHHYTWVHQDETYLLPHPVVPGRKQDADVDEGG